MAVGHRAGFGGHHERRDAREVGAERERHQVEHQRLALGERLLRLRRRLDARELERLDPLHPALDVADGVQVLAERCPVPRPEASRQRGGILGDEIQHAPSASRVRWPSCQPSSLSRTAGRRGGAGSPPWRAAPTPRGTRSSRYSLRRSPRPTRRSPMTLGSSAAASIDESRVSRPKWSAAIWSAVIPCPASRIVAGGRARQPRARRDRVHRTVGVPVLESADDRQPVGERCQRLEDRCRAWSAGRRQPASTRP